MFFGTNGCMYCSGDCTRECIEPIKPMSKKQNARILKDLLEYLKEQHSNLPAHIFETLGEVINDLNDRKLC